LLGVREERNGYQGQIKNLKQHRQPIGLAFFCLRLVFSLPQGPEISGPFLKMEILFKFMQFSKSFPRLEGEFQA